MPPGEQVTFSQSCKTDPGVGQRQWWPREGTEQWWHDSFAHDLMKLPKPKNVKYRWLKCSSTQTPAMWVAHLEITGEY